MVGEDHKGNAVRIEIDLAAAGPHTQLDQQHPQGVEGGADHTDQNGKEHTARTGVNIKTHGFTSKCK